jgi:hypothetical protein
MLDSMLRLRPPIAELKSQGGVFFSRKTSGRQGDSSYTAAPMGIDLLHSPVAQR